MWYPPQQQQHHHPHQNQQQRWLGYNQHLSSQQHQQSCSTTSYYCTSNEPSTTNRTTNTYIGSRNDENEAFNQYHSNRADDVYVTGADYYVTPSTGSYSDEMSSSSLPHQTSNTYWNPVIAAPTKTSLVTTTVNQNPTPSSSMLSTSSSACWDWLLYSPEIYSHLYRPSSSFIQQQIKDEDFDLSTCLPSWLLALLYPSMKQIYSADDENDNDQEISSLHNNNHNNTDESLLSMNIDKNITHVSSNLSLSSENALNQQKLTQNRSSTPDTDDGYQSASDASRSDYSQQSSLHYDHHNSKNNLNTLMPKRISYAAAAKPLTTSLSNNQTSPLATPIIKMKNNSSSSSSITNDLASASGQKLKFIAPRFERMHHAKQYSSSIVTTTTTSTKDLSSSSSSSSSSLFSSTSFTNRTTIRSNNNNNNHHHYHHHPRNHIINAMRRR